MDSLEDVRVKSHILTVRKLRDLYIFLEVDVERSFINDLKRFVHRTRVIAYYVLFFVYVFHLYILLR